MKIDYSSEDKNDCIRAHIALHTMIRVLKKVSGGKSPDLRGYKAHLLDNIQSIDPIIIADLNKIEKEYPGSDK